LRITTKPRPRLQERVRVASSGVVGLPNIYEAVDPDLLPIPKTPPKPHDGFAQVKTMISDARDALHGLSMALGSILTTTRPTTPVYRHAPE